MRNHTAYVICFVQELILPLNTGCQVVSVNGVGLYVPHCAGCEGPSRGFPVAFCSLPTNPPGKSECGRHLLHERPVCQLALARVPPDRTPCVAGPQSLTSQQSDPGARLPPLPWPWSPEHCREVDSAETLNFFCSHL